jgi:hypothetical protein
VKVPISPKWLTLGNALVLAVAIPAVLWSLLSLVLTLVIGDPSTSTIEVPYIELVVQGLLAAVVFLLLGRTDKRSWLIALLPLTLWVIFRGLISGISPLWIIAISLVLLSPLISLLLAGHPALVNLRLLRILFIGIVIGQFLIFPLNFVSLLMDDDASPYDRFSGTLLGKGGYFSSYILLSATALLMVSKARLRIKVSFTVAVLTYAWFAEVKLIWFVAGVVVAGILVMTSNRKNLLWKTPLALFSILAGALLSLTLPSSLGLQPDNLRINLSPTPNAAIENFNRLTKDTREIVPGVTTGDGSKFAVARALMNPWSDLWVESDASALFGVGPAGGLSHLSRTADAQGLFTSHHRPDSGFRDSARILAGKQQQDQSLATQPETTILGIVSEIGYLGLILFLMSLLLVFRTLLKKFDRPTVGIILGFVIAFVPLFSLWETPGFWIFLALGLAAYGQRRVSEGLSESV